MTLNTIYLHVAGQLTLDSLKFIVNGHRSNQLAKGKGSEAAETSCSSRTSTDPAVEPSLPSFTSAAQMAGYKAEPTREGLLPRKSPQDRDDSANSEADLPRWQSELLAKNKDLNAEHVARVMSSMLSSKAHAEVRASDIGGLIEVKRIIKNCIIRPLKRPDLHLGLYRATDGVLLFGPPGTGKTTIAKWIATEARANFFSVSPSTLMSMYLGETESLIKCLFACATKLAPSIIFLDEIDGIIAKRTSKEEETTLRMKNQLLQAMDGLSSDACVSVIVIGATNRPDALDDAAIRRLPKRIYIPLPDAEAIFTQLQHIMTSHARAINLCTCSAALDTHVCCIASYDFAQIRTTVLPALSGFNGSDIKAVCVKAAELVYERTLAAYGDDIDAIPAASAFAFPEPQDFVTAARMCHRSVVGNCDSYEQWATSYGCA